MKLTTLLISIIVFLMSGVVCFLTSTEVFAQVPQTKRSEQDSFLKNVRAKKRNNDLQKSNRSKKYKKETSKIRIRAMFMGEISNEFMKASTTSDYLIWGNWGFGQSLFEYKSNLEDKRSETIDSSNHSFKLDKIKFNEISYTFSKNNSFTLGFGTVSSGKSKIYLYTDDENFYTTRINRSSLFGVYGLEFGFIERLFGYRIHQVVAKDFISEKNNTTFSKDFTVRGGQSMIGLGFIF